MPEYTVKAGDTLSGIGARNGVNWRTITGFRSGNPNLIFPGEVVRWGAAPAPAAAPAAPAAAPAAPAGPSQAQLDETRWTNEGNTQYANLGAFDQAAKSPLDIYNSALESLGISDARTRVSGLQTQLMNTEDLLRNVDPSVTSRTSNSLVTEAQRQRLVAMEQAPFTEKMRVEGRNLENATGNYQRILGEGKTQTDLEYQGQRDKRQAIIDRLNIAKDNSKNASEKAKWEKQIQLEEAKMAEDKRQYEANHALEVQKFQLSVSEANKPKSSGSGSDTTAADKAAYNTSRNETTAFLDKYRGGDGKVSPRTFADARRAWTAKGQDPGLFSSLFGGWANPTHIADYQ